MKKHTQYKEEVTQKILNTARETEKLKKELEELLSLNIKTKSVPQTLSPKLTSVNSSNKVQIIKSYDPKHSKHVKPHAINNTELKDQAEALSPKKIKEYDVEEIRKHIKKQRDKRTDELKSNKNAPKVEKEIRKEKLQELHRKAREILKKNIQHKKTTRSKSQEVPMFRSLNKEPFRKISKLPVEEEEIIINSAGFSFSPTHNTNKLQTQNRNSVSLNNINTLDEPISVLKKNNNDAGGNVLDKNLLCPPKAISNLGYVLKKANKRSVEDHSDASSRKSPDGSKLELPNAESHSSSKKFKNLVQPTLEEPKTQVPLIPVQKSPQKRTPEWLKEAAPSDPFNFINTVKRQLKFINTDDRKPHYVDVGVQGSLEELNSAASSSSSADGKSQFKNNDLRSFISHKCLNLNPEIVDHHVASLHHSSKELKDGPTINYSDNDSDTSKNIPSISSETVASSLRKSDAFLTENNNYYSSRPENLNVARIEGITLKTSSNKTNNDKSLNNDRVEILSVKKQLFSSESNNVSNNYSSDFDSPDLLKKRSNSIISYNRVETPDKEELSKSSRISTEMNNSEEFDSQNALKKLIEKISSTNNSISEAGGGGGSDSHSVKNSSLSSIKTMSLDNSNSKSKLNFNSLGKSDVSSSSSNSNKNQSSVLHTVTSVDKNALKDPQENSKKSTSMEKTVAENGIQIISDVKIFQIPKLSSSSTNFVKADPRQNLIRNITLRTKENNGATGNCSKNPALKFETEIDLLTNFNLTMKRFSEIEKAFESLQVEQVHKNKQPEHKETQTSQHRKSTEELTNRNNESPKEPEVAVNHQNAAERLSSSNSIEMQLDELFHFISVEESLAESLFVEPENTVNEIAQEVEVPNKNFLGILLKMFDRLIKEEDARIDNWKKTLNLREQALLDRTRSELLYLEIQKKQLIETGKLAEASLVKKKQRGIIIKHQQERHEMQRLKQMQKEDSRNLKSSLKKEKKEIKLQLLSGQISPKFKPHSHIRRKSNNEPGPFRVLQQTSESTLLSETSLSRGNDYPELHIKNITTRRHSQMNVVSNITNMELESLEWAIKNNNTIKSNAVNEFKKTLLMREQKLAKRKKTVEELLQWHKRLLDEEKAIENLENEIGTIIGKIPAPSPPSSNNNNAAAEGNNEELVLTNQSSQFNDNDDGSISNAESISLPPSSMSSQISVKPSTANNNNNKEIIEEISKQQSYSTDFEADATDISPALVEVEAASTTTITTLDGQTNISSISKLIENFSKIEDDLLNLTYSKTISDETNNNNKNDEEEDNSENVLVEKETVDVVDEVSSSNSVIDEVVPIIISTASSVEAPLSENDLVVNTSSVEIEEIVNEEDNAKTSDSSIVTASFVENKTDEEKAALSNRVMLKLNPSVEEKINNSQASTSTLLLITEKNINNTTTTTTTAKSNGSDKALAIKGRFSINSNAVGILNEPAFSEDPVTHSVSIKSANNDEINNSPSRIQESPNSAQSSESSDSSGEDKKSLCLDSEVEELQRKQMAIEQEIKLLTEQQQKETTSPSFYVREIPNKPPPPYTPPSKVKPPKIISVTPSSVEEVEQTSEYCAKIIYKAYLSNNLDNITISDTTLNLIAKDIDKDCFKYIFDLCKEIAQTHYSQFQISTCPSWLLAESKVFLAHPKPLDEIGLKKLMMQKVLELHGFAKSTTTTTTTSKREISTAKWSSKKRDHVDQVLVQEMQAENAAWTNYAKDEALVKDRLTNEIMDMLLKETALVLKTTLNKKVVSVV